MKTSWVARPHWPFKTKMGYILQDNEAPIFERFFAGGHRSFRGFQLSRCGALRLERPTDGKRMNPSVATGCSSMGLEYSIPVYRESVRWVFFTDTGTVQDELGFDEYRVSVGTGLRLQVPFLGQAPFAFDFAIPVHQAGSRRRTNVQLRHRVAVLMLDFEFFGSQIGAWEPVVTVVQALIHGMRLSRYLDTNLHIHVTYSQVTVILKIINAQLTKRSDYAMIQRLP